jgi:membrane-bound lytic murein transglycosylase D
MNTFRIYFAALVLNICLVANLGASSYSSEELMSESAMKARVYDLDIAIDVKFNQQVRAYIESYVSDYRIGTERLLGRSELYFPIIDRELETRNLPNELKLLAIVESGLNPGVHSRVGAVGMWQFMKRTGQHYGLEINYMVDQRKDPVSSTKAALEYLEDLYNRFGNWTLAIAAYNCGPGTINSAIRKANSRNYWDLQKYLPRETRNYVPKFIAAAYLMEYYKLHGFSPEQPEHMNGETAVGKVYSKLSFKELSEITGLDIQDIKSLNPGYLKNVIPASHKGMFLMLPAFGMQLYFEEASSDVSLEFGNILLSSDIVLSVEDEESTITVKRDVLDLELLPTLKFTVEGASVNLEKPVQESQFFAIDSQKENEINIPTEVYYRSKERNNRF